MTVDLTTTNILLGVIAGLSVLEALVAVGCTVATFLVARKMLRLLQEIEARHVAPAAGRVNEILDELKGLAAVGRRTAERAERVTTWWRRASGQ
jgi:hypothetical protein